MINIYICIKLIINFLNIFFKLNDFFAENIKNSIAVSMEIKKSAWLQNCTVTNSNIFQLNYIFKIRPLSRIISIDTLLAGFMNIAKKLLDTINKVIIFFFTFIIFLKYIFK